MSRNGEEGPSRVSVVVPAREVDQALELCLENLTRTSPAPGETIVVLDGCPDRDLAARFGVRVVALPVRRGPAAARNAGARHARGDVLLFVDADVIAPPSLIAQVSGALAEEPEVSAVFGSYDDEPCATNLVSLYKNLLHHHVHQNACREASTFWSGCGAIRREAFLAAGGFDEGFARPSIEDIELGGRLRRGGHRIRVRRDLQVKHQKRYSLASLLRSDVRDRALPWTRLILANRELPRDLNLSASSRASAGLVCALVACVAGAPLVPRLLLAVPLLVAALVALNHDFYALVARKRGAATLLGVLPLHGLYFLYSSLAFAWCLAEHAVAGARAGVAAQPEPGLEESPAEPASFSRDAA